MQEQAKQKWEIDFLDKLYRINKGRDNLIKSII